MDYHCLKLPLSLRDKKLLKDLGLEVEYGVVHSWSDWLSNPTHSYEINIYNIDKEPNSFICGDYKEYNFLRDIKPIDYVIEKLVEVAAHNTTCIPNKVWLLDVKTHNLRKPGKDFEYMEWHSFARAVFEVFAEETDYAARTTKFTPEEQNAFLEDFKAGIKAIQMAEINALKNLKGKKIEAKQEDAIASMNEANDHITMKLDKFIDRIRNKEL